MTIRGSKTWDDVQVWKYSAGATQAGSYDTSGQWTLGPTGSTGAHTVNGSLTNKYPNATATASFEVINSNTTANDGSIAAVFASTRNAASVRAYLAGVDAATPIARIGCFTNHAVNFVTNVSGGVTTTGTIGTDASWLLGSATATDAAHSIRNISTTQECLNVKNHSSNTSSDAVAALAVNKGTATTGTTQIYMRFYNSGGSIDTIRGVSGSQVQFGSSSDVRLKTNIQSYVGNLDRIAALRPVIFQWNAESGKDTNEVCYGFIAQEVEAVLPRIVYTDPDKMGTKGVMPAVMIPELVGAIKELKQQFDAYVASHP